MKLLEKGFDLHCVIVKLILATVEHVDTNGKVEAEEVVK